MNEASEPQPPQPTHHVVGRKARVRRWIKRAVVGGIVCGVLSVGGVLGVSGWMKSETSDHRFERLEDVPARPVAIVPGARVLPGGVPSHALEDRLAAALALYEAGRVGRVLVSGDHGQDAYDEPNAMRRWLLERGVPSDAIFMDHAGFRTLDTMERAARVFGVKAAVVCTQRFHLPRSVFLARRAGIDAVGLVADRREYLNATRDEARELLARSRAFADSYIFDVQPRHLGPRVSINGDARQTHDHGTVGASSPQR